MASYSVWDRKASTARKTIITRLGSAVTLLEKIEKLLKTQFIRSGAAVGLAGDINGVPAEGLVILSAVVGQPDGAAS